jgi:hypothetical protein
MQPTKDKFQSTSYLYHDFINPMTSTLYGQFDFDQFLIDSRGQYWFTEKNISGKETSQVFVFNGSGALIKNIVVKGKPTLYEFDQCVIVACEGMDSHSYIYQFCKSRLHRVNEWTIDGFLWDLEFIDGAVYITSYLSSINEAVLYIIDENRKKAIDLGTGVFPSGIIYMQGALFIAFSFIYSGSKGKIAKYDLDGQLIEELTLKVAPRQLFTYKGKIVLHGLDMAKGSADRLVYFNVENGNCVSYKIPKSTDLRPQEKHMLLHNHETGSIFYWSHEKRKIIRVVHLPLKIPTKAPIEKIHWSL